MDTRGAATLFESAYLAPDRCGVVLCGGQKKLRGKYVNLELIS